MSHVPLNHALQNYLRSISISMSGTSVRVYASRLRVMTDALGDVELGAVRRAELEQVVIAYRKGRRNTTVGLLVAAMKSFWEWCVEEELIEHSPAARIKAPPRGRALPRGVRAEILQRVTDCCIAAAASGKLLEVRNGALVLLMRYAGVRRAEAAALLWRDVDLAGGTITVLGKGSKERTVPLHSQAAAALGALGKLEERHGAVFRREGSAAALSLTAINQVVFAWLEDQMGEHITPHQLRHSVATELVERGASLDEVAALLGHEHLNTTRVYVACSAERLKAAVGRL